MRSLRLLLLLAAAIATISVLMLWADPVQGEGRAQTDTVHYAQRAYQLAGDSPATATAKAIDFVCADEADYKNTPRDACERDTTGVLGFPHQYQAIFKARPGFPALMSLFIRVFGDQGIYLTVLVLQVATGMLLVLAARSLGLPGFWPLAAEVTYFLLPSGFVGTRVLSEAATAPGLAALLYALTLFLQDRRPNVATATTIAAFAWLFAVRAADATMAAAFLLLVALAAFLTNRTKSAESRPHPQPWPPRLALISAASLTLMIAISSALAWPTINQGITDTMTEHFTRPATGDLYVRFLHLEFRFWRTFLPMISGGAYLVALAALGLWGVIRWLRGWAAATFLAIAAVGAASLVLHPGDWTRMLAPMWIVVSSGLVLLAAPPATASNTHPPLP